MIKVSILVPLYNTSIDELQKCIDSLLGQEFERYEIIIVDDGSDLCPARESLLTDYLVDSKVSLIRHCKNLGLPSARNTGLRAATGEYVVHVDSDDFWITTDVLQTLYETALIDGCDVLRFNGQYSSNGRLGRPIVRKLNCINTPLNSDVRLQIFRSVFLFFCRREFVLEKNLYFNSTIHLGEDAIYVSKLLVSTTKISSVTNMFYAYTIDNGSMMRSTWRYEDFVDENNAVVEVIKNLSSYPKIAIIYSWRRYNMYMLKALYPRAIMDLSRDELKRLSALYVQTRKDIEEILGLSLPVGRAFKLTSWYYFSCRGGTFDGLLALILQKSYPKAKQYYKFFGVSWIFRSIRYRVKYAIAKFGVVLPPKFSYNRPVENLEGLSSYNLQPRHHRSKAAKKGLSVMLRVKNEEQGIVECIESIIDLCAELVIVDNNSVDNTVDLVKQIISSHIGGHKIKLHHYPFQVARCGVDHDRTPENSVHSLAYYYNWCLDKCSYNAVIKWDADMVVSKHQDKRAEFQTLIDMVTNARLPTAVNFITQSFYLSNSDEGYLASNELNREIRIFSNRAAIFFIKEKHFESLAFFVPARIIHPDSVFSFELKRLWQNEFDHWSSVSFATARKVAEYRSFRRLMLVVGSSALNDYCSTSLSEL